MSREDAVMGLLDALAETVAERVAEKLRGTCNDMVDQSTSRLGPRRHIAAVRRRLAAGLPGAARMGRTFLLSQEALREEMATAGRSAGAPCPTDSDDVLAYELGLVRAEKEDPRE